MTNDDDLIAALRKCSHCDSTGNDPGWCRLDRMASDRIEAKNRQLASLDGELKAASACEIAQRVRERCAKECEYPLVTGWQCARVIRALTVEELLKGDGK